MSRNTRNGPPPYDYDPLKTGLAYFASHGCGIEGSHISAIPNIEPFAEFLRKAFRNALQNGPPILCQQAFVLLMLRQDTTDMSHRSVHSVLSLFA